MEGHTAPWSRRPHRCADWRVQGRAGILAEVGAPCCQLGQALRAGSAQQPWGRGWGRQVGAGGAQRCGGCGESPWRWTILRGQRARVSGRPAGSGLPQPPSMSAAGPGTPREAPPGCYELPLCSGHPGAPVPWGATPCRPQAASGANPGAPGASNNPGGPSEGPVFLGAEAALGKPALPCSPEDKHGPPQPGLSRFPLPEVLPMWQHYLPRARLGPTS